MQQGYFYFCAYLNSVVMFSLCQPIINLTAGHGSPPRKEFRAMLFVDFTRFPRVEPVSCNLYHIYLNR